MKKIAISLFVITMFNIINADTIPFQNGSFIYKLDTNWVLFSKANDSAYLNIYYKRNEIRDSHGTLVIPNLIIKLIPIVSNKSGIANLKKAKISELDVLTQLCLLNFTPPEVYGDYKKSKNVKLKYKLKVKNYYGFNSPYIDNFKEKHTCLYFTIYDEKHFGVFIGIDSTEEIFANIENEIIAFLQSIEIK